MKVRQLYLLQLEFRMTVVHYLLGILGKPVIKRCVGTLGQRRRPLGTVPTKT